MIRRVAARVGLVVLAALAASWLAYDLRALSLDSQARAEARVARRAPQVDRALSLFTQAARGNADPAPRIDEARFLLALGRSQRAADVLDAVVRANPGNIQAWSLLATATANDPRRSAQADAQLRLLIGHPFGHRAGQGSVVSPAGVLEVAPGRVLGHVDSVRVFGKVAQFAGWSAAVTKQPGGGSSLVPPEFILIVSDGRLVASGTTTAARPDVTRVYGAPTARVGFIIGVPTALLESAGPKPKIQVFGSIQSVASQLPIQCSPTPQPYGCGS